MMDRGKLAAASAVAILAPAAIVAMLLMSGDSAGGGDSADAKPFKAERQSPGELFPSNLEGPGRYPVASIKGRQLLYTRPGGRAKVRIADETEWNNPRVLSVVRHRGAWLAVLVPELRNGKVGWIHQENVTRLSAVTWSVHADLSKREIVVRHNGKRVRRLRVGIGRPGHNTPKGRFAVTDRLKVTNPSSPYGCCVLALTGHQTRLPPGWPGGDRLAVHATADLSGLGRQVSLGCMRAHPREAAWLIRQVPLGAPVFIRG